MRLPRSTTGRTVTVFGGLALTRVAPLRFFGVAVCERITAIVAGVGRGLARRRIDHQPITATGAGG